MQAGWIELLQAADMLECSKRGARGDAQPELRRPPDGCDDPYADTLPASRQGGKAGNSVDLIFAIDVDDGNAPGNRELEPGPGLSRAIECDPLGRHVELERKPELEMRNDFGPGTELVQRAQYARQWIGLVRIAQLYAGIVVSKTRSESGEVFSQPRPVHDVERGAESLGELKRIAPAHYQMPVRPDSRVPIRGVQVPVDHAQ